MANADGPSRGRKSSRATSRGVCTSTSTSSADWRARRPSRKSRRALSSGSAFPCPRPPSSAVLGRLVEAYALERGIDLSPYGAWTLKNAPNQAGAEPDECYIVGSDQSKEIPDLAIEVVWTSSGIDKLEIYRRIGIGEVWFWRAGCIDVHLLHQDQYERAARSRLFPDLDLELLCSLLDRPTALQAVKAFRETLRS